MTTPPHFVRLGYSSLPICLGFLQLYYLGPHTINKTSMGRGVAAVWITQHYAHSLAYDSSRTLNLVIGGL